MDISKVTRLEVIDWSKPAEDGGGRVFVHWDDKTKITLDRQDDGRTLKVFIEKR